MTSKGTTLFPGTILYFFTKYYEINIEPAVCTPHTDRREGTINRFKVHKCGKQDKELYNLQKIVLKIIQVGLFIPVMPALKKLRLEDHKFKASMSNVVNLYRKIFIIIFIKH